MSTLSATTLAHPIETFDQFGGHGRITNKALAIPVHVGGPWRSAEYVELDPAAGCPTEVGEHEQATDEIYLIVTGTGLLTTNGSEEAVGPGFLALAPRGTRHRLQNRSPSHPLGLLVVELLAPAADRLPTSIPTLYAGLAPNERWHSTSKPIMVASVDLAPYFSGPWGTLRVVCLPDGARVHEYTLREADELLFLRRGFASITAGGHLFTTEAEGEGLSVLVPAGMPRHIINRACSRDGGTYPLLLISLEVCRQPADVLCDGKGEHPCVNPNVKLVALA